MGLSFFFFSSLFLCLCLSGAEEGEELSRVEEEGRRMQPKAGLC